MLDEVQKDFTEDEKLQINNPKEYNRQQLLKQQNENLMTEVSAEALEVLLSSLTNRSNKMAYTYCEDCGCKVYNGRCTNCHEELYILDQYYEQHMELPDDESDFMKKVREQQIEVSNKQTFKHILDEE